MVGNGISEGVDERDRVGVRETYRVAIGDDHCCRMSIKRINRSINQMQKWYFKGGEKSTSSAKAWAGCDKNILRRMCDKGRDKAQEKRVWLSPHNAAAAAAMHPWTTCHPRIQSSPTYLWSIGVLACLGRKGDDSQGTGT